MVPTKCDPKIQSNRKMYYIGTELYILFTHFKAVALTYLLTYITVVVMTPRICL